MVCEVHDRGSKTANAPGQSPYGGDRMLLRDCLISADFARQAYIKDSEPLGPATGSVLQIVDVQAGEGYCRREC